MCYREIHKEIACTVSIPAVFQCTKNPNVTNLLSKVGGLPEDFAKCTMAIKDSVHDSFEVH